MSLLPGISTNKCVPHLLTRVGFNTKPLLASSGYREIEQRQLLQLYNVLCNYWHQLYDLTAMCTSLLNQRISDLFYGCELLQKSKINMSI